MKQITFELLRHGPPNNQLLSPLTQYLALCENHPATTLQVPFEHNQFLHRLAALSYKLGNDSRLFQVKDTAKVLGDLLGEVPGLVAEMNRDHPNDGGPAQRDANRATHLRMVLSCSELALLPFELALSPPGFPGAGEPLLLQYQDPVCLTREVRRIAERTLEWPRNPKILFISAFPGGTEPLSLVQQHLNILNGILDAWGDHTGRSNSPLDHLITHLPFATCDAIAQACSTTQYSHVHILAHGQQYNDGFDVRHGLALHDRLDPGKADVVSGERLATALRPLRPEAPDPCSRPLVVTLASCDSANQGSVYGLGGGIAYALHQAEIPMVIASQFPLSVPGSIDFVRMLYEALLWGRDPRLALNGLRRRLHTVHPATHDWASVSAYASLPENFDRWLFEVEIHQTVRSMEAALSFADYVTEQFAVMQKGTSPQQSTSAPAVPGVAAVPQHDLLAKATSRMDDGRARLENLFERQPRFTARLAGKLAAIEKRCAQTYFYFVSADPNNAQQHTLRWQNLLQRARQHYWTVFETDRSQSWSILQFLSLDLVLRRLTVPVEGPGLALDPYEEHNQPAALWSLVHDLSLNDLRGKDDQYRLWALGNLVELYLIAPLVNTPRQRVAVPPKEWRARAMRHAHALVDLAGPASWDVYCTRRQILRYANWYPEIAEVGPVVELAWDLAETLPTLHPGSAD